MPNLEDKEKLRSLDGAIRNTSPTPVDMSKEFFKESNVLNPGKIDYLSRPLPYQLLAVCRMIFNDLDPLIYGHNTFIVSPSTRSSLNHLNVLYSLSSRAWSSVKSLHVGLNAGERMVSGEEPEITSTHSSESETEGLGPMPEHVSTAFLHEDPRVKERPVQNLQEDSSRLSMIIKQFKMLCQHMQIYLFSSQLHFKLNCNTDDHSIAGSLVQHLRGAVSYTLATEMILDCTI